MKQRKKMIALLLIQLLAGNLCFLSAEGIYSKKTKGEEEIKTEYIGTFKAQLRSNADGSLSGDPNDDGIALGDKVTAEDTNVPLRDSRFFFLFAGLIYVLYISRKQKEMVTTGGNNPIFH
jgi:hypothetical protein